MNILLTNDDGFDAPGIRVLAKELQAHGHSIIIVAPLTQQSATSHSITLFKPIKIHKIEEKVYAVGGTPTDCMIMAEQKVPIGQIDLVISGINCGQNMGEDILYSGTVAAALEAMFLGFKAIAISSAAYSDVKYHTAAKALCTMLDNGILNLLEDNEIFNINVPNIEPHAVQGIKVTRMGHRRYENFVREEIEEDGSTAYYIGGDLPIWEVAEDTDFSAVDGHYISITPIRPDFTNKPSFDKLHQWSTQRNEI